jgi:hypothetical protein
MGPCNEIKHLGFTFICLVLIQTQIYGLMNTKFKHKTKCLKKCNVYFCFGYLAFGKPLERKRKEKTRLKFETLPLIFYHLFMFSTITKGSNLSHYKRKCTLM